MQICLTCAHWGPDRLCGKCRGQLVRVGVISDGGLTVFSGYQHQTTARRLVHLLKYQGIVAAARPLAAAMVESIPDDATALAPVPRAWLRRARYGVDPALELAGAMARITGVPLVIALQPRLWWPAHAGSDRVSRAAPRFRLIGGIPRGAVLVDDVLTTGATLRSAAELTGTCRAVTATRA